MSALEPGLYRATVRGVPDRIATLTESSPDAVPWVSITPVGGAIWCTDAEVTDARPLIVLDLSPFISDARLVADLRAQNNVWSANNIADQIEAQAKPARIPEPTQSGVRVTANLIVHDNAVVELMRLNVDTELPWVVVNRFGAKRVQCGWQFAWDALLNQKVVAS